MRSTTVSSPSLLTEEQHNIVINHVDQRIADITSYYEDRTDLGKDQRKILCRVLIEAADPEGLLFSQINDFTKAKQQTTGYTDQDYLVQEDIQWLWKVCHGHTSIITPTPSQKAVENYTEKLSQQVSREAQKYVFSHARQITNQLKIGEEAQATAANTIQKHYAKKHPDSLYAERLRNEHAAKKSSNSR